MMGHGERKVTAEDILGLTEITPDKTLDYEDFRNLNNNAGCWECPYLRQPIKFSDGKYRGLCSLLEFSPCAYPQAFTGETRFNLPCVVYQEFKQEANRKSHLRDIIRKRHILHGGSQT